MWMLASSKVDSIQKPRLSLSSGFFVAVFFKVSSNFPLLIYRPNAQPHSSIVCENNSHKITCPLGRVIEVTGAIYGRLSTAHCRNNNYHNTNCKAYSSLSKTSSLCNGKPSCYLYASNSVYGDPCNGIHKYLDVTYKCIW